MYDITKMISSLKGKRGDHRIFRLSENLCMNLLLSMREFFIVKREGKVTIMASYWTHFIIVSFDCHNET